MGAKAEEIKASKGEAEIGWVEEGRVEEEGWIDLRALALASDCFKLSSMTFWMASLQ